MTELRPVGRAAIRRRESLSCVNVAGARPAAVAPIFDLPNLPGARCVDVPDVDVFHPSKPSSRKAIAQAKEICASCPVRAACLEWCLEWERENNEIQHGVWGGVSEWERKSRFVPRRLCQSGRHELVGENVRVTGDGGVRCRACHNEATSESHGKAS